MVYLCISEHTSPGKANGVRTTQERSESGNLDIDSPVYISVYTKFSIDKHTARAQLVYFELQDISKVERTN